MRILLSFASEFDKGEGIHFERVLRRLGHHVIAVNVAVRGDASEVPRRTVVGFRPGESLDRVLTHVGGADLFLYVEPLGLVPRGLECSSIPTACVVSDVHRDLKPRQTLARLFDQVYLYQRNYRPRFDEHPPGAVHWLPWSCDAEVVRDLGATRDLEVAFIGQRFGDRSARARVLDALAKRYRMNEQRYYLQREIPEVYSRARIVVNVPAGDDLNCRFFEAMSCGALLVTQRLDNGQAELFKEGVHYVAFDREEELFEQIDHYLHDEASRARIAAAGHEEVLRHHTLAHRLESLLASLEESPKRGAPVRRLTRDAMLHTYAAVYEWQRHVEALLALTEDAPERPTTRVRILRRAARCFLRRCLHGE